MTSSISGTSRAIAAPARDVSTVILRSARDSFSARIAGVVISTSPIESSLTQRSFAARSQRRLASVRSAIASLASVARSLNLADLLDHAGGAALLQIRQQLHCPPELFHQRRFRQIVAAVVAALHEHVRPDRPNQLHRRVLLERHDVVDAAERAEHLDTVIERIDRPAVAL